MHIKTAEEYIQTLQEEEEKAKRSRLILNASSEQSDTQFFKQMRRDQFNEADDDVILIDPGVNLDEKLREIDLPCNLEQRINNQIDAPMKTKHKAPAPQVRKTYSDEEKGMSIKEAQKEFMIKVKEQNKRVFQEGLLKREELLKMMNSGNLNFDSVMANVGTDFSPFLMDGDH